MLKVAVLITDGSEELEAVTVVDVLRRSKSLQVELIVLGQNLQVECSRQVRIVGDVLFEDANLEDFDAIVLPGGMRGARAFEASVDLQKILQNFWAKGKLIAAICASVVALKAAGIGKGVPATSHPCVRDELQDFFKYDNISAVVEFHDSRSNARLVTSRGPGTALAFAVSLLVQLTSEEEAFILTKPLMIPLL